MRIAELLISFLVFIVLIVIVGFNFWFPLFNNAPECIFSHDAITCTQVKALNK